jgi:hypothetical protein
MRRVGWLVWVSLSLSACAEVDTSSAPGGAQAGGEGGSQGGAGGSHGGAGGVAGAGGDTGGGGGTPAPLSGDAFAPTCGGLVGASAGYSLVLAVGAPAPYGAGVSSGYRVRIGAPRAPGGTP